MVFTNMFAIFYLETICMTKKTAMKQKYDKRMGHYINCYITGFFLILFGLTMIVAAINYNVDSQVGPYDVTQSANLTGLGIANYTTTAGVQNVYIQPYSIFLKGWYSDLAIYTTGFCDGVCTSNTTYTSTTPLKTAITVYDISQVTLCVILFLH